MSEYEDFKEIILNKFGVMPFRQSDGGMGLMGKGVPHSYEKTEMLELLLKEKDALLERISGMCGNPDAAEGCRNILKLIKDNNEIQN